MKKYHLLSDFGIYKTTVKRNFEANDRGPEHDDVRELLGRRTQFYTLDEIRKLAGFLWTAHDDCVMANPELFYPIQVATAAEKIRFGESVIERLKVIQGEGADTVPCSVKDDLHA